MDWMGRLLLRTFGRPQGALGRLGGRVMARTNSAFAHSFIDALEVGPDAKVLEVGFGPGMAIEHLAGVKPGGRIALGFTPHSRQADEGAMQAVSAAAFAGPRLLQLEGGFGVIAERSGPA